MSMNALHPLPKDERDIRVGGFLALPKLSDIPDTFGVDIPKEWIIDQEATDTCAGQASALGSSVQEGVRLAPLFPWVVARTRAGLEPSDYGCNIRDVLMAHTKVGALEWGKEQYTIHDPSMQWRNMANWDLNTETKQSVYHKKSSMVMIEPTQGYDWFDTIRATLWALRDKKITVVVGLDWVYGSFPIVDKLIPGSSGHAVLATGMRDGRMVIRNSFGTNTGENGTFYVSRDVINHGAAIYGAGFFYDETPENIRWYIEHGVQLDGGWGSSIAIIYLRKFMEGASAGLKKLLQSVIDSLKNDTKPTGAPSTWLLPAIIWQESEGNDNAIGDKHLRNHAYGPLQIRQPYMKDVYPFRNAQECLGNRKLSIEVWKGYMALYATEKRLGRPVTDQDIARIHNGGPNGHKKDLTLPYWYQVQNKLRLLEGGKVDPQLLEKLTRTV